MLLLHGFRRRCSLSRSHWTGTHALAAQGHAGSHCADQVSWQLPGQAAWRRVSSGHTTCCLGRFFDVQGFLFALLRSRFWSSTAQGSCGAASAGRAAMIERQLWVLRNLLEASWDLGCDWHSTAVSPDLALSRSKASQSTCKLVGIQDVCSVALALVLEGQEVCAQQMGPEGLQLTPQLMKRRTLEDCDAHRSAVHSRSA